MPRWSACIASVVLPALLLSGAAGSARAADSAPDPAGTPSPDSSRARPSRWALVLSGGMALGLAQIGVVQALDEQGIRPDLVVGSRMGGLIGALYATGLTGVEIERIETHIDWDAALDTRDDLRSWRGMGMPRPWLRLVGGGLRLRLPPSIKDDSYLNFILVETLLEGTIRCGGDFDLLPIPLRVVTTDPQKLFPVVLRNGDLARAVRATLSVPLVFPPVPMDGRLLVDGGTASNLPVGVARAAGAERVHVALIVRRKIGPLPAYMSVQGAVDRLGWRTQGSLEGTSLQRGITGWFLRGGARESQTRLYGGRGLATSPRCGPRPTASAGAGSTS